MKTVKQEVFISLFGDEEHFSSVFRLGESLKFYLNGQGLIEIGHITGVYSQQQIDYAKKEHISKNLDYYLNNYKEDII